MSLRACYIVPMSTADATKPPSHTHHDRLDAIRVQHARALAKATGAEPAHDHVQSASEDGMTDDLAWCVAEIERLRARCVELAGSRGRLLGAIAASQAPGVGRCVDADGCVSVNLGARGDLVRAAACAELGVSAEEYAAIVRREEERWFADEHRAQAGRRIGRADWQRLASQEAKVAGARQAPGATGAA